MARPPSAFLTAGIKTTIIPVRDGGSPFSAGPRDVGHDCMETTWLLAPITLVLLALCFIETRAHRRALRRIPIRIHVNGTRGKSSVTRLIAGALREAGVRTCAKTTGTLPRFIDPDGRETQIGRLGRPNVIEQLDVVRRAGARGAEALVVECMAVQPRLQWLSESMLIRATHAVITNARSDHLETMGPWRGHVALALAATIPPHGKAYTAERRYLPVLQRVADERDAQLACICDDDLANVSPEDMAGFAHVEHEENVAVALRACRDLGVDRQTALRGMWKARPDPGAMTTHELTIAEARVCFVNGFAANDAESAERVWRMSIARFPEVQTRILVWNCRADRPERSRQLARACARWPEADRHLLIGDGTATFARAALVAGIPAAQIVAAEARNVERIAAKIAALAGPAALVAGMGNIGGAGMQLVRYVTDNLDRRETE